MGILFRLIRFLLFVTAILLLGQITVAGRPIAVHVTEGAAQLWRSGPEAWARRASREWGTKTTAKWLGRLGLPGAKRPAPKRPVRDDIPEVDRARLQKLLERST